MSYLFPILSKAESYAVKNDPKRIRPSPKKIPYSAPIARQRVEGMISSILLESKKIEVKAFPEQKVVTKLVLHPSFLAKSYFPTSMLTTYELESLGSKEVLVEPIVRVTDSQKKSKLVPTSQIFISGKIEQFQRMLQDINSTSEINNDVADDLKKIEDFSLFDAEEKYDNETITLNGGSTLLYEVVLHSASKDCSIFRSFLSYISSINGEVLEDRVQSIDGLTFLFVKIDSTLVRDLAAFSYVRVVRNAPSLKLFPINTDNRLETNEVYIANSDSKVSDIAVFDAGLRASDWMHSSIRYFDLTDAKEDTAYNLDHGSKVASAIVYGDQGAITSSQDILNIDHYKVYSHLDEEGSQNLYDVLARINSVLSKKTYRFVNLCLGPSIPRPDDEPNLWTSMLDKFAEKGETLFIIAVGNDGGCLDTLGEAYARIQPPADMLNGLAVGAATSREDDWDRAEYSCIGPGRRPGHVKPDIMFFGGSESGDKVVLSSLEGSHFVEDYGTSFAAPLVTRQAALIDKFTKKQFSISTIRALLVHSAQKSGIKKHTGWGKLPNDISDILYCSKNRVTFIYQGLLNTKSGVRAALPFDNNLEPESKVALEATMCFFSTVDVKNPSSYSKTGVEVTFKPHLEKFGQGSKQPKSRSLFTKKKIFGDELFLRDDQHKWETCFKVTDRMMAKSLHNPVFDIRFSERDEGQNLNSNKPLNYSLIVTIEVENEDYDLYGKVMNRYPLLNPIDIDIQANVEVEA